MIEKIDLSKNGITLEDVYRDNDYTEIFEKYKDPATVYAYLVLEGKVIAGYMIKLAMFRHLQDLRRAEQDPDFNYYYDLESCRKILNFSKLCPDVNTGIPLPLMIWQRAILCLMQGWRDSGGNKRFDRVLMSVARTNGKTYLVNILLWYAYLVEAGGQWNQDLGYIAPVTKQSMKGFRYVKTTGRYLEKLSAFKREFKKNDIRILEDTIKSDKNQNNLVRLSQESGQFDSLHFLICVSDEAGDDKHIGTIKENNGKVTSGQVQTDNSQFVQITTAYPDSNSYVYADEKMMRETMEKDYERILDNYLCLVWEQDSLDETNKPELWGKSNPVLDLEDKKVSMLRSLISERDTMLAKGKLHEFQNKNLNCWLQVKQNRYLDLDDLESAVIKDDEFDINNRPVYIGWDLSQFSDDTAIDFIFPYTDKNGNNKWHLYQHSWIPLARSQNNITIKERSDGINYRKFEEAGYCDIAKNDYGYIDEDQVYHWLLDFVSDHNLEVKAFVHDTWRSDDILKRIDQQTDWIMFPLRQGTRSLNDPTVSFRKEIHMGNITMFNDGILQYSFKNAIILNDNNGVKIDKDKQTTKIDCVDAAINAWDEARYHFKDIEHHEEKENKSPFGNMNNDQINDYFKKDFSF